MNDKMDAVERVLWSGAKQMASQIKELARAEQDEIKQKSLIDLVTKWEGKAITIELEAERRHNLKKKFRTKE